MEIGTSDKNQGQISKRFRNLLLATAIATLLLIIVGYVVRVTNSTLGCPDWPTCYGQYGLPAGINAQIQYFHRIIAFLATFLTLLATAIAIWRYRSKHFITVPLVLSSIMILVEVISGSEVIKIASPQILGLFHLALALSILALLIFATMLAYFDEMGTNRKIQLSFKSAYEKMTLVVFAGILGLMIDGVLLINNQGNASCSTWPYCANVNAWSFVQSIPSLLHGLLALVVMGSSGFLFFATWRHRRNQTLLLSAVTSTTLLFFGQVFIGLLKVVRNFPVDLIGVHATVTAALWASVCVLAVAVGVNRDIWLGVPEVEFKQRVVDFIKLTKPLIIVLLLITTVAGMIIGAGRLPTFSVFIWTVIAGALAAGGSSAINQYIDRDLDKKMQRTAKRPVAAGRLFPAEGLAFGIALCLVAFFLFTGFVNLLAGVLALAGMVYYVLVYSILLKKVTVQNIVIGGGAGAIPPLVGWAAATNSLNVPSLLLFAIVFFWTPPHFWALALVRANDYARAGIPMLPVVKGERQTRVQIFVYTLELVGLTLLLPLFKLGGSLYFVSAITLGGLLIYNAGRVLAKGGNKTAWKMYRYSSIYLALLFFAMVLDVLIRQPG